MMPDNAPEQPDDQREAYGLPDCTNPVPLDELPDRPESVEGAAMRVFGKPFGELARRDQRMITAVQRANERELRDALRVAVRQASMENAMSAHDALGKMDDIEDKALLLMNQLADDCVDLVTGGDNMDVTASGDTRYMKTPAGTKRRNLRHVQAFMQVKKTYTETLIAKAKLADEKLTVVQNVDNRQQAVVKVTPDEVKERLGRFGATSEGNRDGANDMQGEC